MRASPTFALFPLAPLPSPPVVLEDVGVAEDVVVVVGLVVECERA